MEEERLMQLGYDNKEEELLLNFSGQLGYNWSLSLQNDPETVGSIIIGSRNILQSYENFLLEKVRSSDLVGFVREQVPDRLHLIFRLRSLPLFGRYDPTTLTETNLPPRFDRVADCQILESTISNMYISTSWFNSLVSTSPAERREKLKGFVGDAITAVMQYETTLAQSKDQRGVYRKDFPGRAQLYCGYESLAERAGGLASSFDNLNLEGPGIFEVYGPMGLKLEVKRKRLFPQRRFIIHNQRQLYKIKRNGKHPTSPCWPLSTRLLFIDVIPQVSKEGYRS